MSRIYFHTPSETVEVYGTERAWLGQLCSRFAVGIFDMLCWERKRDLLPDDWRRNIGNDELGIAVRVDRDFGLFVRSSGEDRFADGQEVFATVLNTVLRLGSRPMGLAARIHGQCEIHGYVEPEDGEFIASLIEEGLAVGVFRGAHPADENYPSGWREACRVLRAGEIVVTSYSVCDRFPNQGVALEGGAYKLRETENPDEAWDDWYDLPEGERWDLAVTALRTGIKGLRWSEAGWDEFYFGSGHHALDYVNVTSTPTAPESSGASGC